MASLVLQVSIVGSENIPTSTKGNLATTILILKI